MISICRACSHTICCHRIDSSRLTRSRSFDCSKSTCRLIRAVPPCLFAHPIRRAGRSMAGVLGIPSAAFSASPGLAVLRPSLRSSDTRDETMMSPACEVHTTEVVCFWLLRPSAHSFICRAAGAYSPRGKSHTNPCCRRIQSKERQRDKKARQMSQAIPPHEHALTSKPLAKDQLSPTTRTYFERNTAEL